MVDRQPWAARWYPAPPHPSKNWLRIDFEPRVVRRAADDDVEAVRSLRIVVHIEVLAVGIVLVARLRGNRPGPGAVGERIRGPGLEGQRDLLVSAARIDELPRHRVAAIRMLRLLPEARAARSSLVVKHDGDRARLLRPVLDLLRSPGTPCDPHGQGHHADEEASSHVVLPDAAPLRAMSV